MEQIKWYQLPEFQLLQVLKGNVETGLSNDEVTIRQKRYGKNEWIEKKRKAPWVMFLHQFNDFMVWVLVAATIIAGILGEYLDSITIISIILLNGILGFVQQFQAERSLYALKQLAAPTAYVFRAGKIKRIPASELVQGDIIQLTSGDRIPADIRWLETSSCYVEEAVLTGESAPVCKNAQMITKDDLLLGDMQNMGFMGTMITRGSGKGIVIRIGMETEIGKIANLIENTRSKHTPLQNRLTQLGKLLIIIALFLTVVVVMIGIMHGQPIANMLLAGISLAVASIPEGLPAIVTIVLALGVQRMIRRNTIVRKLPSVETLGCASVICSDKTGTLTENKMTVTEFWIGGRVYTCHGEQFVDNGQITAQNQMLDVTHHRSLTQFLQISALCNNATLIATKQKQSKHKPSWDMIGDPTEGALLALAAQFGTTTESLAAVYKRVKEFPFDSERKRMSVIVQYHNKHERFVLAKGAPDVLLARCQYILWDNKIVTLTSNLKRTVLAANKQMAKRALRVLALAYRKLKTTEQGEDEAEVESQLIFVGLTGMIDPPRQEAREAISLCRRAGIKTIMITGDHQLTAQAIAQQLDMIPPNGLIMSGEQLTVIDDNELDDIVEYIYIYARVSPAHKLRIVQSLQRKGHVVAMTGDGVNDAPAIKMADIGISMGISGTDVSKEAASIILLDDNFATIVAAIEEGRGIYENIRKFIRYLLASNVGEILVMFFAMLLRLPLPLVPIQILWVNLVTDGLPAMALGVDQAEQDVMKHRPRSAQESIFSRRLGWKIISRGLLIGVCTLLSFWLTWSIDPNSSAQLVKAQSVAFATLILAQLIHVFDCRSSYSIFHRNCLQNKYLVYAVVSSLFLMLSVIYIKPLQLIFKTVPLLFREWVLVFIMAGIPTFMLAIGSIWCNHSPKPPHRIRSTSPVQRRIT